MPKVANLPLRACLLAMLIASWNASMSWMTWSADSTNNSASFSPLIDCNAAAAIAGAVFLPIGSSRIVGLVMSICLHCSATKKRWSALQIIIGSARLSKPLKRNIVSCSMVLSPTKGKYCLGYCLRDSGQSRVPEPPERITGIILDNVCLTSSVNLYHIVLTINSNLRITEGKKNNDSVLFYFKLKLNHWHLNYN